MDLTCEQRTSDSPLVESVWRSRDAQAGSFISMAESQFSLVMTTYRGRTFATLRGPSTSATPAFVPPDAEFVGIDFKPGVYIPGLPPEMLVERRDLSLPEAAGSSFWLLNSVWQYPDYENADAFVDRLVRRDLLACDPVVMAVLCAQPVDTSLRTVRRRFLRATGLTHGSIYQVERARHATRLLKQGASILDTVARAGYFDQPHLTRSLKRYIGLTPAQVIDEGRSERLSFLYKTSPIALDYNRFNADELQQDTVRAT